MAGHGTFHWNELMTRDPQKSKDFYSRTLGWTYEDMPMPTSGTYTIFRQGEEMVAGMMKMEGPQFEGMPEHWFAYIAVDDVDQRLELLKAEGGKVLREPVDAGGVGRFAIVQDSGGAVHGWITPAG
ncbi:MAG: VOC family protein [Alphaproteobacteria bacterium]